MAKTIKIAGELESLAAGGKVVDVTRVKDAARGNKSLAEINAEHEAALEDRYTKEETYSKEQLNNLITTPGVQYVSVTATDQTTAVTDVLPATGAADTIYRVGSWNGKQYDATVYSEYAWNGTKYEFLCAKVQAGDGAFDISEAHSGTPYADLAAALGANGVNVPENLRKGGMSVKFIQGTVGGSDNKYVQYRLMATSFTTNEADWQGVESETLSGNANKIPTSSVVSTVVNSIKDDLYEKTTIAITRLERVDNYALQNDGTRVYLSNAGYGYDVYELNGATKVFVSSTGTGFTENKYSSIWVANANRQMIQFVGHGSTGNSFQNYELTIDDPVNAVYVFVSAKLPATTAVSREVYGDVKFNKVEITTVANNGNKVANININGVQSSLFAGTPTVRLMSTIAATKEAYGVLTSSGGINTSFGTSFKYSEYDVSNLTRVIINGFCSISPSPSWASLYVLDADGNAHNIVPSTTSRDFHDYEIDVASINGVTLRTQDGNNRWVIQGDVSYEIAPLIATLEEKIDYPLKNKVIGIIGDSIMNQMSSNIETVLQNVSTYVGTDGNTYTWDDCTLIGSLLYVTSSLEEGEVTENSIRVDCSNTKQEQLDAQDWNKLKDLLGASDVVNCGLGGATIQEKDLATEYPYPNGGKVMCISNGARWLKRLTDDELRPTPDIIIIWAGTNSMQYSEPSNFDEIAALSWETLNDNVNGASYRRSFYGGLRWTIEFLLRSYPNAQIIVLTPLQRKDTSSTVTESTLYNRLSFTANAMIRMAGRMACLSINALNDSGVVSYLEPGKYLQGDKIHLSNNGKNHISEYLCNKIKENCK